MLGQCHEMLAHQRASPRWKEWIPLVSQQLRLRNLIQVIAYNVNAADKGKSDLKTKVLKSEKTKSSFYYTLHLTTMSAPFYTSEKLENENPKWAEIEIGDVVNAINGSVNGLVVRLWMHRNTEQDQVLTVWGVYFNGLVYLGPKLCSDPAAFCLNTVVFHMQGGYFTASQCFKEPPTCLRHSHVKISSVDVRPSYTVNLVLRLHTIQQAIKKQRYAAQILREKIAVGGFTTPESHESATLRRLLNKSRPQAPQRQQVLKLQSEIETTKFRVDILSQERSRKLANLQNLGKIKSLLLEINQNREIKLMNYYQTLHKETEQLKEKRKTLMDTRDAYLRANAQLIFRQKQLISKLKEIYPVKEQMSGGKYSICGIHLPNSEDFGGSDEIMISVSLGYVAHVLQMLSVFLQVPLRYPIIHFGSWSKIIDHISEKIPEKDKEFPLFSRGKDKLQFCYGVYLLNKNVSQLRWYCNLSTYDLRATLPNLSELLNISPEMDSECHYNHYHQHSSYGSSLDLHSSQNQSPVGSAPVEIKKQALEKEVAENLGKDHSISRSVDNADIGFQVKLNEPDVQSAKEFKIASKLTNQLTGSPSVSTSLSYSLDKGLDEYEELKKAELPSKAASSLKPQAVGGRALASMGSEPILTQEMRDRVQRQKDMETVSSEDDAKEHFLQNWQARGPAPVCSDDEAVPPAQQRLGTPECPDPMLQSKNTEDNQDEKLDKTESEAQILQCTQNSTPRQEDTNENEILVSPPTDDVDPQNCHDTCSNNVPPNEVPVTNSPIPSEGESEHLEGTTNNEESVESECNSHSNKSEFDVESKNLPCPSNKGLQNGNSQIIDKEISNRKDILEEAVTLEEMNNLLDSSVLEDSVFASVASRTEALANRSGSFNLVRSRHSSVLEDGNS